MFFPCNPDHPTYLGEPLRARGCRCDHPWVFDGGCERCGHWTEGTIDGTWAAQAKRLRGGTWAGKVPRVAARGSRRLELVG